MSVLKPEHCLFNIRTSAQAQILSHQCPCQCPSPNIFRSICQCERSSPNIVLLMPASALKPKYLQIYVHVRFQAQTLSDQCLCQCSSQILSNQHMCQGSSPNIFRSMSVSALKPKYCPINACVSTQAQISSDLRHECDTAAITLKYLHIHPRGPTMPWYLVTPLKMPCRT